MESVSLVQEWQFVEDRINPESLELEIILEFPVSFNPCTGNLGNHGKQTNEKNFLNSVKIEPTTFGLDVLG